MIMLQPYACTQIAVVCINYLDKDAVEVLGRMERSDDSRTLSSASA